MPKIEGTTTFSEICQAVTAVACRGFSYQTLFTSSDDHQMMIVPTAQRGYRDSRGFSWSPVTVWGDFFTDKFSGLLVTTAGPSCPLVVYNKQWFTLTSFVAGGAWLGSILHIAGLRLLRSGITRHLTTSLWHVVHPRKALAEPFAALPQPVRSPSSSKALPATPLHQPDTPLSYLGQLGRSGDKRFKGKCH